ncbi:MAG: hypothetical protein AABX01_07485 [Candidatus Micrarchaeota archaeon]
MRLKHAFVLFGLIYLFNFASALFSSENVQTIAFVYGNKDEAVEVPKDLNPIIYDGKTYWHAYIQPQDSKVKNLIIIVRQEGDEGILEENEGTLRELYSLDYDLESLQILRDRGISFQDLRNIMDSLKFQLDSVETPIIDNIKRQSDEDLTEIDDSLFRVQNAADDALSRIMEGIDSYETFISNIAYQDLVPSDLELIMERYDGSVNYFHDFVGAADKYQKAVQDRQKTIGDPAVATELAKLANFKVKDSVLRSYNASLALKKKEFSDRKMKRERFVNDTIYSLQYRKARTNAQYAYTRAKNAKVIDSLLAQQNEPALNSCRLSNADLLKRWDAIEAVMDPSFPRDTSAYLQVPEKVAKAEEVAANLNDRLKSCINATPRPTTPAPEGFDYKGLLMPASLLIILVLAAYYLNGYMKRKPEDIGE